MVMAPVRVPVAVGVKVTLSVHDAPGFTVLPQLLVWAKSPAVAILVMLNGPLASVLQRRWLGWAGGSHRLSGKVKLAGVRLTSGTPPVPVSES